MPLDTKGCMPLLEHEFDMKVLKNSKKPTKLNKIHTK